GAGLDAGKAIELTAAELAQAMYVSGTTGDAIAFRAFDGIKWGTWTTVTVNPTATFSFAAAGAQIESIQLADNAPIVSVVDLSLSRGATVAASSLFSSSDIDGDSVASVQFQNTGNGAFVIDGVLHAPDQTVTMTANQLAHASFLAGRGNDV